MGEAYVRYQYNAVGLGRRGRWKGVPFLWITN